MIKIVGSTDSASLPSSSFTYSLDQSGPIESRGGNANSLPTIRPETAMKMFD